MAREASSSGSVDPAVDHEAVVGGSDLIVLPGRRPVGREAAVSSDPTWVWFGASPGQRIGRERWNVRVVRHAVVGVAAALFLLLFGLTLVGQFFLFVMMRVRDVEVVPQGPVSGDLGALTFGLAFNLVLFTGIPAWWTWTMYGRRLETWTHRLFIRTERPGHEAWVGAQWALGMVLAAWMVSLLVWAVGGSDADAGGTPAVLGGFSAPTAVLLVLAISGVAALSEEFFFRGWLQPRVGVVPANLLFGMAHLSYGTWLQFLVPMGLGFGFSWLTVHYRSLWPALVAHFLYDVVQLGLSFALAGVVPQGSLPPVSPLVGWLVGASG